MKKSKKKSRPIRKLVADYAGFPFRVLHEFCAVLLAWHRLRQVREVFGVRTVSRLVERMTLLERHSLWDLPRATEVVHEGSMCDSEYFVETENLGKVGWHKHSVGGFYYMYFKVENVEIARISVCEQTKYFIGRYYGFDD